MSDGTEDDFAALFEASLKSKRIEQGQTVEGTIVAIGPEVAFVDVGGKGEATIDVAELKDEDGDIEVAVGERIQAVVVSTSGGLILSRRLARGAASARQLEDAYRAGLPVQGKVEREVKGGYEVRVGHARGFCPFSQIDIVRTEAPAHVGRVYEFRIVEYKDGGRNLVLSRRALLEEARKAEAEDVRRTIVPGAIVTGRVASVRDFGAFIDLGGGVQGLLHVSEMGWSRVDDPSNLLTPGEPITVKVLAVDAARQKISLGLKQLSDDPWSRVQGAYEIGQIRTGRVTRLADFGAFVELEPGIEALAHASTFPASGRRETWSTMVAPGTTAVFEIVSIDSARKRIGVALVPEGSARARAHEAAAAGAPPAQESEKTPEAGQGFGSLADKLRGALGPKEK
jgi:small subunit ribosomal protein S1